MKGENSISIGPLDLWIVRHGQTMCNVSDVLCGSGCDVGLTETGFQEAHRAAAHLRTLGTLGALFASPQQRAQQTAQAIAEATNVSITTDARLQEIAYGKWEGVSSATLATTDAFMAFRKRPELTTPPGGENLQGIANRVSALCAEVINHNDHPCICFVTHKTTHRVLLCHLLQVPLREYRQRFDVPSGCLSRLTRQHNTFRLISHGPQG